MTNIWCAYVLQIVTRIFEDLQLVLQQVQNNGGRQQYDIIHD
jgi:hypothetical protein